MKNENETKEFLDSLCVWRRECNRIIWIFDICTRISHTQRACCRLQKHFCRIIGAIYAPQPTSRDIFIIDICTQSITFFFLLYSISNFLFDSMMSKCGSSAKINESHLTSRAQKCTDNQFQSVANFIIIHMFDAIYFFGKRGHAILGGSIRKMANELIPCNKINYSWRNDRQSIRYTVEIW